MATKPTPSQLEPPDHGDQEGPCPRCQNVAIARPGKPARCTVCGWRAVLA